MAWLLDFGGAGLPFRTGDGSCVIPFAVRFRSTPRSDFHHDCRGVLTDIPLEEKAFEDKRLDIPPSIIQAFDHADIDRFGRLDPGRKRPLRLVTSRPWGDFFGIPRRLPHGPSGRSGQSSPRGVGGL